MKTFLVTLKPIEPYFFGNEKNFSYSEASASGNYFIKGETVPSQSTVLGALRYLLLPVRKSDWSYSDSEKEVNAEAVGALGFEPGADRTFGKILNISPVFLVGPKGEYVVTPFDHVNGQAVYTPFKEYKRSETSEGEKYFAEDYDSKIGLASGYMALADGTVTDNSLIFGSTVRLGINRSSENKGLFKKEYKILDREFSFAVYVTLGDGVIPQDGTIFAGQGKSAFSVKFSEEENHIEEKLSRFLRDDTVYCFGDTFAGASVYNSCLFAATRIKTYRSFRRENKRVRKGSELHRIIAAGSIFIPVDKAEFMELFKDEKYNRIGYNKFITK